MSFGFPPHFADKEANVQRFFAGFTHAERMYHLVETPQELPPANDEHGLSPVQRMIVHRKTEVKSLNIEKWIRESLMRFRSRSF